jgi:hypothetical protein
MSTYYAWSNIYHDAETDPDTGAFLSRSIVKVGETVDSSIMPEEDWDYLVAVGAVRQQPYPQEIDLASTAPETPMTVLTRRAQADLEAAGQEVQPSPPPVATTSPSGTAPANVQQPTGPTPPPSSS